MVNNLIGNAVRHGFDGGKVVLSSEDTGGQSRVEIYNDSRPIGEDEKARLFKRFSRRDAPEKKGVKGTGPGLFITRRY